MKQACRICRSRGPHLLFTAREMMYGTRESFDYFECASCGCLQLKTFPGDMSTHYPANYYSFGAYDGRKFKGFKGGIKKKLYRASALRGGGFRGLLRAIAGVKEYEIFKGLGISKESRILDVGCGNGRNFLYPLAEIGFGNLLGCDPFLQEDLHYENGLKIRKAEVFDVEGTWDLITYHHAFEHLPNPKEHLLQIAGMLSENGVCVIRIPTVSSYAWKHYGTNWVQLDAPRHFFLHSNESMALLADEAGMDIFKIEDDSTHFQFLGSEKYRNNIPLSAPKKRGVGASIERAVQKNKYGRKAKGLNRKGQGDQSAFYLRRK